MYYSKGVDIILSMWVQATAPYSNFDLTYSFTFGMFPVRSVGSVASQEARAVELSSAVSTLSSLTSSSSGSEQPPSFRCVCQYIARGQPEHYCYSSSFSSSISY